MKLGSSDDLGQFFHVGWLDIHNVKTLVLNIKVPEVDSEIITADEGLAIAVHGNAVDVVCMGIRVCPSRYSGNDCVMVSHAR